MTIFLALDARLDGLTVGANAALDALPMFARYRIGAPRVGVVHAEALAGWGFDAAALNDL